MIIPLNNFPGRISVSDVAVSSEITASPPAAKPAGVTNEMNFRQQIARECDAMARYALGNGLKMPAMLMQSLDVFETVSDRDDLSVSGAPLPALHCHWADVGAPATPRTIYLLHID